MFEESLVESTGMLRTRKRGPVIASIAAQATIVAIAIAVPLLHPEIIHLSAPRLTTLNAPVIHHDPPPPPRIHVEAVPTTTAPSLPTTATPRIDNTIREAIHSDLPPTGDSRLPVIGGSGPNPLSAFESGGPSRPVVTIAPAAPPAPIGPIHISTGVGTGLLLTPIQPLYPQIAKITHTEGTVLIQAIISKQGRIESAQVISGPPTLVQAALDAVRNARYRPYTLNGQPVEVDTTFSINFRLSNY